jgi:hypothetical protein
VKKIVAVVALSAAIIGGGFVASDAATHPAIASSNPAGGNYHALSAPGRLLDTRSPKRTLGDGSSLTVQVTGQQGIPATATSVVLNVTVAGTTTGGYLSVVPNGADPTSVSTVNWSAPGTLLSNTATVGLPNDGAVTVYNRLGSTDVVLDVLGYYTDAPTNQFGQAQFQVNGATWEALDTYLAGAPNGDNGTTDVRFTCRDVTNGCNVTLQADTTVAGYKVYPRIILQKEDNTTGDVQTCEYADGADNNGASQTLTTTPATVTLGIGSTADCGGNQTGTQPASVDHINVPGLAGQGAHYNAQITLTYTKSGS